MKYEYMKEYPCDGVKPDLPDDVLVQVLSNLIWLWLPEKPVGEEVWKNASKFIVTDESFKPKLDWFECGENPPINTECEVWYKGEWHKALIVGYDRTIQYDAPFVVYKILGNVGYRSCSRLGFRPLRDERDELMEELVDVINSVGIANHGNSRHTAAKIIDAGWRPTREK